MHQFGAGKEKLIFGRKLHRVSKHASATRHNADFVHRIGVRIVSGHEGVPHFVIRNSQFFFLTKSTAPSLRTRYLLLDRFFEIALADFSYMPPRCQESGL